MPGRDDESSRSTARAETVKQAFWTPCVTAAGRLVSDSQTAYRLAIMLGLANDEDEKRRFGDLLAFLVRREGYRLSTGFLGTRSCSRH